MNHFTYVLEPYKGLKSRHTCPSCGKSKRFSRYISTETGEYLAPHVGRCDREENCGYHLRPSEYIRENPRTTIHIKSTRIAQPPKPAPPDPVQFSLSWDVLNKTLTTVHRNNFLAFLESKVGRAKTLDSAKRFHLGTSRHWPGATIFWQIDEKNVIRTGKVMLYDPGTGKRVKEPFNHITWVHKLAGSSSALEAYSPKVVQCLFGLHQLREKKVKEIVIVESEKTAIIASIYLPQFTWLACGGLNMLSEKMLNPVREFPIILYPDIGAYHKWEAKALSLQKIGFTIRVSFMLEKLSSIGSAGLDLADFLLSSNPPKGPLDEMIRRRPLVGVLVERLGLVEMV